MCAAIASGRFRLSRILIDHAAGDFRPALPIETDPAVDIARRQDHVRRIIVSLHGTGGDAVQYYNRAVQATNLRPDLRGQTLAVAPQFFYQDLVNPGRSEVNGAFARDIVYWEGGRAYGNLSASNTQNPRTFAERSYHAMDALLEHLTRRDLFPNLRLLVLLGHSNGGQFVARYSVVNTFEDRCARPRGVHIRWRTSPRTPSGAISCTWPGQQDTAAGGTCEDDRQGPNTLARTLLNYYGLRETCGSGIARAQKVVVVPGVGHNGLDMMTSARGVEERDRLVQPPPRHGRREWDEAERGRRTWRLCRYPWHLAVRPPVQSGQGP